MGPPGIGYLQSGLLWGGLLFFWPYQLKLNQHTTCSAYQIGGEPSNSSIHTFRGGFESRIVSIDSSLD